LILYLKITPRQETVGIINGSSYIVNTNTKEQGPKVDRWGTPDGKVHEGKEYKGYERDVSLVQVDIKPTDIPRGK
jgi:hypothetical protein